jgi:hypothetical protein
MWWEEEEFGDLGIGEEVEVEEGEGGAAWFGEGMEEGGEVGEVGEDFGWSRERERGMGWWSGRGCGGEFAKVLDEPSVACGIVAEMGWVGGEGGEEDFFGEGGGAGEEESEAIIL